MGMRFRMHGCGPRRSGFPEGLFAMGFGPRGGWGPERGGWDFDWGSGGGRGGRGRHAVAKPAPRPDQPLARNGHIRLASGPRSANWCFNAATTWTTSNAMVTNTRISCASPTTSPSDLVIPGIGGTSRPN